MTAAAAAPPNALAGTPGISAVFVFFAVKMDEGSAA